MAFAADFSGTLVDLTCSQEKDAKIESCNATTATTAFAISVDGKLYKLDTAGNTKATAALKGRGERSADPVKALVTPSSAKVAGSEKDGTITVESIEVQ